MGIEALLLAMLLALRLVRLRRLAPKPRH
jgi:hypothetical protein